MDELSVLLFESPVSRMEKDHLFVTWHISNVFTSKQASKYEREAARKALLSQGPIETLLNTTDLEPWEIACNIITYHLYGPQQSGNVMRIYTAALPDPNKCVVDIYEHDGMSFVGISLIDIPRIPVSGYVPIQGDTSSVLGTIPWIIEIISIGESNEPEYQVDLIFRVEEHPDSIGLARVYH